MLTNGSCLGTRRRMSARLDGDLDARSQGRFDRHLAGCRRCAQALDALRRTLGLLHETGLEPPSVTRSVVDDVLARIDERSGNGSAGVR